MSNPEKKPKPVADYLTPHAQLTALQDAVKEDIDARYAQAALACSGSANKYEWLKASQRVGAASKALRALVDPPQQKET